MYYTVYLWPLNMGGYQLDAYSTQASSEEEALEKIVAHLVNNNFHAYYCEVDDIDEDDAYDMGLMYIDATMEGADRPVYIDISNARIEKGKVKDSYFI